MTVQRSGGSQGRSDYFAPREPISRTLKSDEPMICEPQLAEDAADADWRRS